MSKHLWNISAKHFANQDWSLPPFPLRVSGICPKKGKLQVTASMEWRIRASRGEHQMLTQPHSAWEEQGEQQMTCKRSYRETAERLERVNQCPLTLSNVSQTWSKGISWRIHWDYLLSLRCQGSTASWLQRFSIWKPGLVSELCQVHPSPLSPTPGVP